MKPWYDVVKPREDLRDGKPLDASEFAVHLDHVRDGRGADVYRNPQEFFERTYPTKNLRILASQVVRRLSGVQVETSAVFNLSTQFGGGKTHALTLLYHLARNGASAKAWKGVPLILEDAGITAIPTADTAVFVGTEFDSITGRGGSDGTPLRHTPWGEVAFQLGGVEGFRVVEEHDKRLTAPGGDVIEKLLDGNRPTLILLDELMNYVSRSRKSGLSTQLYDFLHNLSEVARGRSNVVVAVSIPASELEMSADDQSDFERYKKLLDRLGKALIMSAETETSEIIRRRLFEWGGIPKEGRTTASEYAEWLLANRQQVPTWFPVDNAREAFEAAYPFHPTALSVFERKWRGLPRFQQTRGVLRLLALWVSRAYADGYKGAHKDPLISLGTAPLDDSLFRAAVFEQLGEQRLEAAITTDVAGSEHAHAVRFDAEAIPEVKKARLHRKVATVVLFESNGGQQRGEATLPEIRLAVGEPQIDIGHVEQCLESLTDACYFLSAEKNRFRFSFQPNLNKILADRRASVPATAIQERVRIEVRKVFEAGSGVERVYFPEKSGQVPDRPALTLSVLHPDLGASSASTTKLITQMTSESGASARTFKSALLWAVAEDGASLADEARKLLAWEDIQNDREELKFEEPQRKQLSENVSRAHRDLREAVWRSYKNVFLLSEDNTFRRIDMGLVHSSAATTLVDLMLKALEDVDLIVKGVSPNFLTRYWPPALSDWSTKSVRDAFYASPKFPRLLKGDAVRETISRGLDSGLFAYVGKAPDGRYEPFVYKHSLAGADIEISDDVFLISRQRAEEYVQARATGAPTPPPPTPSSTGQPTAPADGGIDDGRSTPAKGPATVKGVRWSGDLPAQKWMNFYTKVLSRFATGDGLKLTVTIDVAPADGVPTSKVDETRVALRELGLSEAIVHVTKD